MDRGTKGTCSIGGIAGWGIGRCCWCKVVGEDLKGGTVIGRDVGMRDSGDLVRVEVLGVGLGMVVD